MRWFQEGERGLAMSIRQTAVPLGGGLGALILPWLASTGGFRPVYGVLAAMCAVSGVPWQRCLFHLARNAMAYVPKVAMRKEVGASLRAVFDALPSGTNVVLTPEMAYAWCRYDPINYSDPNGHSVATGFGMFYSIVSFFLWPCGTSVLVAMDLENLPQTGATSEYTAPGWHPQPGRIHRT